MIPDDWVWLEGVECPNCYMAFLFAEQVDEDSSPLGEIRCLLCGASILGAAVNVRLLEDES